MNCENGKIFDPHRLLLNLSDKINLKMNDNYVTLSNKSIFLKYKNIKSHIKTINLKYQLRRGMISLNSLLNHILN